MKLNEVETINELAQCLEISEKNLTYVLYANGGVDDRYHTFVIPKKSGGERSIDAPDDSLKFIQRKLAEKILEVIQKGTDKPPFAPVAQAYQKKLGIFTNGTVHRNKKLLLNVDLENFFPSIHFGRIIGYFMKNTDFFLPKPIAVVIAKLTCHKGVLAQGSSVSPIISNLICQTLDQHILKIARQYHLIYSRYADDMSFSTNDLYFLNNLNDFFMALDAQINKDGFVINRDKLNLSGPDVRHTVTGLSVNKKVNVPVKYYKNTRAMVFNLYTKGSYTIDGKIYDVSNTDPLEGRLSFINNIESKNREYEKKSASKRNVENKFKNIAEFSAREKTFRNFLFYKNFYKNQKTVLVTEGHTDIVYLKSAVSSLGIENFDVRYLNRTNTLHYFFGLGSDPKSGGGTTFINIYNLYHSNISIAPRLMSYGVHPEHPVILLFDHDYKKKDSPIRKFLNHVYQNNAEEVWLKLHSTGFLHINNNLYAVVVSKDDIDFLDNKDIEDLFPSSLLKDVFGQGVFESQYEKKDSHLRKIGKNDFSLIMNQHKSPEYFIGFQLLIENIQKAVDDFHSNLGH